METGISSYNITADGEKQYSAIQCPLRGYTYILLCSVLNIN